MGNPFSHLSDEKLMKLYQEGENMAFELLYARHKAKVYSYLNKRVSQELVDDIFQSIFIKFHKTRKRYNAQYPLLKWIYVICRSELLDALKKKKIQTIEFQDNQIGSPDKRGAEFIISLEHESTLTNDERDALQRRYFSDQEFKEISTSLNTSESNVRKLISRGLKKLRDKYLGGNHE